MSNRLATETSPYLRQHADNPVHWWPWCAAALDAARAQDKPILLSIGYSACHWCHVMAHESFEDPVTAAAMNEKFICIKVDREERPDLDKIYQLAHQALTQRGGGWPLTMFLAADDLTPFYAGTYFPREARYGMPPFGYVLEQVRGFWDQRRDAVRTQNATLREFLEHYGDSEPTSTALSDTPINAALAQIECNFDSTYGGHRGAPKFPHGAQMELLLAIQARRSSGNFTLALKSSGSAESAYASMVDLSLTCMAEGGIHDQIGGGFCRYSVDERWEIPHFEKMLYDNAQLLPLYAHAARAAQSEPAGADSAAMYRQTALDLVTWLQREMTSPDGAFYAALDADSEGEEGRFYVWQAVEVRALLSADEFAVVERRFGFDRAANFEQHAWNPIIATSVAAIASALELADDDVKAHLQHAREKLFIARARRVRPALDDKILTAWNALMIGGLARASRDIDSGKLMPLAERALDFIHTRLWQNGRLFASHAGGSAKFAGYLDDYAFLLDALLEMLINRWSERDIAWAMQLADGLLKHFEDRERGGFWFTANNHEALIQRPKPWTDDAIPSGNGIAARALLRLGHLSGETRYLDAAERTLRAGFASMSSMPQGCASLQRALLDYLHPRAHIVLRYGSTDEANIWRRALGSFETTNTDSYFIPSDAAGLRGVLDAQKYIPGGVAYVCRGVTCAAPITDPEKLS